MGLDVARLFFACTRVDQLSDRTFDLGPFPVPEILAFHEIMQRHRSSKKDAEAQIISEVIGLQIVQKGENKEMARCHCADEP